MTDDQLADALATLGITRDQARLVSLLPLVQVAWADGRVQPRERELILGIGRKYGLLEPGDEQVVERWLAEDRSPFFHGTARKVLTALALRAELPGGLDREAVVGWCWALASAAGGLFGTRFLSVSGGELKALDEIAMSLDVDGVPDGWTDLTLSD